MRLSLVLVAMLVAPLLPSAAAQSGPTATVRGVVVDRTTGAPLPGAHVFVAQSMIGTTADADGRFLLRGIPLGATRLYASMLGYEPAQRALLLQRDTTFTLAFRLPPTVLPAGEVTVTAERDKAWYRRLRRFKRLFIGESDFADECRLLNPEALRFETKWWGKFAADAVEPLIIENRALGYRVQYFLEEFEMSGGVIRWDGEPLFEPLSPRNDAEAQRWRDNRIRAYRGSLRHFLRALLDDRIRDENFRMYRLPRAGVFRNVRRADRFRASRDNILTQQSDSLYHLHFTGRLEVIYEGEEESRAFVRWARAHRRGRRAHQVSQIKLNDPPIRVDAFGEIVEPYGATVYEYFSFELRIAELLPLEYRPPES